MLNSDKQWVIKYVNPETTRLLTERLNISPVLATVLVNRNVTHPDQVAAFIEPSITHLYDPFLFRDMTLAVETIKRNVYANNPILIWGDYDVDGITGTKILFDAIAEIGGNVAFFLPKRVEGYGLNAKKLAEFADSGIKLIITVDCGTSSKHEIAMAKKLGLDIVITDHHEPGDTNHPQVPFLNPRCMHSTYPFRDLSGAGVAFKLALALLNISTSSIHKFSETSNLAKEMFAMVALGTIADMMPLCGENRILAKFGLSALSHGGINAGMDVFKNLLMKGVNSPIGTWEISYIIAPRINAPGRFNEPEIAMSLLSCDNTTELTSIVYYIDDLNKKRQQLERLVLNDVKSKLTSHDLNDIFAIVLSSDHWESGVVGTAAAKVVELYNRPTILISLKNGIGKGSGRSTGNLHLFHSVLQCRPLLTTVGGHKHAVGLAIKEENIPIFKEKLNKSIRERVFSVNMFTPKIVIDCEVDFGDLSIPAIEELSQVAPYGISNPEPIFISRHVQVIGTPRVVGNGHVKMKLRSNGVVLDGIAFRMLQKADSTPPTGEYFDAIYTPTINRWNNKENIQVFIKGLRSPCTV